MALTMCYMNNLSAERVNLRPVQKHGSTSEFEHVSSKEEINLPQPCTSSSPLAQKLEDIPVKYKKFLSIYFYVASF